MPDKKPLSGIALYLDKTRHFSPNAQRVLLYSASLSLSFGVFQFLFNFYVLSLGYNEGFVGTLQTVSSLAAIAMALPAAYIARRYSQKSLMVVTAIVTSLSFLGSVLLPFGWALLLFRVLAAVALSLREVAIAPFLMQNTTSDDRQWVFSFNFGIATMAMFMGSLIGGWLPTLFATWLQVDPTSTIAYQLALAGMLLLSLFSVWPLFGIRTASPTTDPRAPLPWDLAWQYRGLLTRVLLPQIIIGLGAGTMQPFMNIYFRKVYEQPDTTVSLVFAVGGLSMAVAQFLGPPVADRIGKINTVIVSQALSIPFLILLGTGAALVPAGLVSPGLWFGVAFIAYVFRLGLMNMSNPVYQTFILEHVPDDVQTLSVSLNAISFQFGWFVMPQVSGWLQVRFEPYGFVPVFAIVIFTYVTAILVEWFVFKVRRSVPETPAPIPAPAD